MKIWIESLFVIGMLSLVGCATMPSGNYYRMTPIAEDDVVLDATGQGPVLVSEKANMAIFVGSASTMWLSGERPSFNLSVANLSDYGFRFGMENVRVRYNGELLNLVSPEVLVVEAKRKEQRAARNAGLMQFLGAVNQHMANYGSFESSDAYWGAQGNAELLNMVVREADVDARTAAQEAEFTQDHYQSAMLKEQFIGAKIEGEKGHIGGGVIFADIPEAAGRGGYFELMVDVDGEYHDFRFEVMRVEP